MVFEVMGLLCSQVRGTWCTVCTFRPFSTPFTSFPSTFTPFFSLEGGDRIMMMGDQVTTGTFMMHRSCMASLFMHDESDPCVEYNSWAGIDISLKEHGQCNIREALCACRQRNIILIGVATSLCFAEVVSGFKVFPIW